MIEILELVVPILGGAFGLKLLEYLYNKSKLNSVNNKDSNLFIMNKFDEQLTSMQVSINELKEDYDKLTVKYETLVVEHSELTIKYEILIFKYSNSDKGKTDKD